MYEVQTLKYRYFDYLHEMTRVKDLRFNDDDLEILIKESQAEAFPLYDVRSRYWAIVPQYFVLGAFVVSLCGWMYITTCRSK